MTQSITVPPGCTGIETPSGKKIDANRQGRVVLDDPRDAKWANKSTAANLGIIGGKHVGLSHVQTEKNRCQDCGFDGWPWQTICPKCNGEMIKETR